MKDLTKLEINFDTVLKCEKTGKILDHHFVHNRYQHPVDWNNARSVGKLNGWRRQILGRNFPPTRKTREFWLQSEKDLALELIKQHLLARGFVKWRKLANEYNRYYTDVVQRRGEKLLTKFGKMDRLENDRAAPWRTSGSLIGMAIKWPEVKDLYKESEDRATEKALTGEEEDEHLTSEDEAGIPDPNPEPLAEVRKRKPQGKKREDASATKSKANMKTTSKTKSASKVKKPVAKILKAKTKHKSESKSHFVEEEEEEEETEEEQTDESSESRESEEDDDDFAPPAKRPRFRDGQGDEEGVGYL